MSLLAEAAEKLARNGATTDRGCIEWTAGRNSDGYGNIHLEGRTRSAHRMAWAVAHGRLPPACLLIRHTCDNPPCVNPQHLLLGTDLENQRDRSIRGKGVEGEKNPKAKLTWKLVRTIRTRLAKGEAASRLAQEYHVTKATVGKISRNETWKEAQ